MKRLALIAVLALALTGCSGGTSEAPTATEDKAQELADAVLVGELASARDTIAVGEVIPVIVDLPDDEWEVTNTNPRVIEIDTSKDLLVRLVGVSEGESTIEFTAENGDTDSITVMVNE
ncbi:MAG: hypothetical protein ACTHYD_08400 [Canibacter sp.]